MKCPNCKKKLSNSATFCKYCGKRIEIAAGEQIPHKFLKLKNKKFVLLGIIIIVMIFYLNAKQGYVCCQANSRESIV